MIVRSEVCVSGSVLTGSEIRALLACAHGCELGIWSPPGPQPGQSWASLVLPAEDEAALNTGCKGALIILFFRILF